MGKVLIVANWKMNPGTSAEAKRLFGAVQKCAIYAKGVRIVVCPPFVYLMEFTPTLIGYGLARSAKGRKYPISVGAQNCFWEEKGAFTGEISAKTLKDIGCEYVIVGHSERRRYFGEADEIVNKKIKAVLHAGLKPILCVGETQEEKERGEMANVLREQVERGLRGVKTKEIKKVIIAYEPVWAIGKGKNCAPEDAESAGLFIRKILTKHYSRVAASRVPILYGGSVNAQNAASYIKETGLHGLLVGGASLDPKEFNKIVKSLRFTPPYGSFN